MYKLKKQNYFMISPWLFFTVHWLNNSKTKRQRWPCVLSRRPLGSLERNSWTTGAWRTSTITAAVAVAVSWQQNSWAEPVFVEQLLRPVENLCAPIRRVIVLVLCFQHVNLFVFTVDNILRCHWSFCWESWAKC